MLSGKPDAVEIDAQRNQIFCQYCVGFSRGKGLIKSDDLVYRTCRQSGNFTANPFNVLKEVELLS
jgi:hypothetical protein